MSVVWINTQVIGSIEGVLQAMKTAQTSSSEIVCISSPENFERLGEEGAHRLVEGYDIRHSGAGIGLLQDVQSITFSWYFLDPPKDRKCFHWKASSDLLVFHLSLYNELQGFDPGYDTLGASILDFCYRAMLRGARIGATGAATAPASLTQRDELRFVSKFFSASALTYFRLISGNRSLRQAGVANWSREKLVCAHIAGDKVRTIGKFSAIIPTLNRYDYLIGAIDSLLSNSFPPDEVLVIDQTPVIRRVPGYYDKYKGDDRVKIVFLDQAGQASSRNVGITMARNEWIYFFDDDSVCWKDCLSEHRYLLEHSSATVSTGVSLAPWKNESDIKSEWTYYRLADVLDTGNCCIQKRILEEVGMISLAFERGPGADDDLGKRIFLAGHEIVWNPKAVRTHYKAKSGGLREHGAWWRTQSRLFDAFPPPTQLYMLRRYYPAKRWFGQIVLLYLLSRKRQGAFVFLFSVLIAPLRYIKALRQAKVLESKFG